MHGVKYLDREPSRWLDPAPITGPELRIFWRKFRRVMGVAMASKNSEGFFDFLKTIIYAVAIALVVRTVAFEPFNIPSKSMLPTLEVGDYLFVSKYSYGYSRHSLPFSIPLIPGRILATEPERGDVAVFKTPSDNRTDFIKRIKLLETKLCI